jgi:hypothetical protein
MIAMPCECRLAAAMGAASSKRDDDPVGVCLEERRKCVELEAACVWERRCRDALTDRVNRPPRNPHQLRDGLPGALAASHAAWSSKERVAVPGFGAAQTAGRTALTALSLAVGVGLVVIVAALAGGLDDAQEEVLEPLTGVGTDLSVSRPIVVPDNDDSGASGPGGPFGQLPERERRQLLRENRSHTQSFNYADLGEPNSRHGR